MDEIHRDQTPQSLPLPTRRRHWWRNGMVLFLSATFTGVPIALWIWSGYSASLPILDGVISAPVSSIAGSAY